VGRRLTLAGRGNYVLTVSTAVKWDMVSESDYLAGELVAEEKHEYIAGVVYAMAGGTNRHARIGGNVFAGLHARLRGKSCDAFNSDTKVKVLLATGTRYYYPDAMVVCDSNAELESFQDRPRVIVEVLSESTRRTDEWEKKDAYISIATLGVYLMVEQDRAAVVAWRRGANGFEREGYEGLDAVIPLPEIGVELPLSEIYEGVQL